MTSYQKAPPEILDLLESVRKRHHPSLTEHEVTFDVLLATEEEGKFAVKCNGYPALAVSSINNLKARTIGHSDGLIVIDHARWEKELTRDARIALLDHELEHFEVRTKDGVVQTDDLMRPKLLLRKHDVQFGWFESVALRNGSASIERRQAQTLFVEHGQAYFPFISGTAKAEPQTGRLTVVKMTTDEARNDALQPTVGATEKTEGKARLVIDGTTVVHGSVKELAQKVVEDVTRKLGK